MTFTKLNPSTILYLALLSFGSCFNSNVVEKVALETNNHNPTFLENIELTRSPLYFSEDYGVTWRDANQGLPAHTEMSFMEKMGIEMVSATDNLGVFVSENNKTSWKDIGKGLPSKKVNALHISEDEIFVGVYRKGIFSTKNHGKTWKDWNYDLPNLRVQSVLKINDQLLAGTDIGIFRLEKNKKQWQQLFGEVQVVSMNQYKEKLVAGTHRGTLLSKDNGDTWQWIHQTGAAHNTAILNEQIIIMNVSGDVFISDDWGVNWMDVNYFPRKGSYVYEVAELDNFLFMSNNYGIHRSTDNGKTWEFIYKNETYGSFDLLVMDGVIYGGTRTWDEYRGKSNN